MRHELIVWRSKDLKVRSDFDSLTGKRWSTSDIKVQALRKVLLELQHNRCAYCQCPIESDGAGYRELDHVLPQKKSQYCDASNGYLEATIDERRHTNGYSKFTYNSRNMAISCKDCNTSKGTFDALRNRVKIPMRYPRNNRFLWVHPQLHRYSAHIKISENFTYSSTTSEGLAVIGVCKLDQAEELTKRFLARARSSTDHAGGFANAVSAHAVSIRSKYYGLEQGATALSEKYLIDYDESKKLIELKISCENSICINDFEKYVTALSYCNSIKARA